MTPAELLLDALDRVEQGVEAVLDGLDAQALAHRVGPDANPIGWLVWHLLRGQDVQVADVAGTEQVWTSGGWHERLDVPYDAAAMGYGQTSDEVGALHVDAAGLLGYSRAVHAATRSFVGALSADDLDRVVDERWDPPVTLGVRLVSVIDDDVKHLGQAEYVRGLLPPR